MPDRDYIKPDHLRTDADHVPGQREAQKRIVAHTNRLYAAWNSLDIFDQPSAMNYLSPVLVALCGKENTAAQDRTAMAFLMFALVAVEADRTLNRNDRSDFSPEEGVAQIFSEDPDPTRSSNR